jgi:hypothetical protein
MSEARIKTFNLINSLLTQHKQVRPGVADIIACEIDNYIDELLERQVEACAKAAEISAQRIIIDQSRSGDWFLLPKKLGKMKVIIIEAIRNARLEK